MKIKTLIHTAFLNEAKPIIKELKLECKENRPYNIYINEKKSILLLISGVGEESTKKALNFIQEKYTFEVFINFGIAGCVDKNIEIGSLFCTNKKDLDISFATISSHNKIVTNKENIATTLVDMESEIFLENTPNIEKKYVFKVVSDYLEDKFLSKKEFNFIIEKNLKEWLKYV